MFKTMIQKIKVVMHRMGLIKGKNKLSDHKEIPMNDEMYNLIEMYKDLYKGFHADWHNVKYQTIDGQKTRRMDTLNMAKTSAAEMSSLVFNEKCEISIGDDENETSEFIDDVFKKNKFNKKFQDFLEYSFAHGGMVIKPYVEGDEIKLSFVNADCFIPIAWGNETITEAVFVDETRKGDKKYTLLEWHTWENTENEDDEIVRVYTIKNELYEAKNGEELGIKVSLDTLYPGLKDISSIENLKKPVFVHFKPNTANNFDTQSPLGIPLYANALSTMKSLDTAFDSFHREFRLGKKRIFVPDAMIKVAYGQDGTPHRYFDANDETYQGYPGDMDEKSIHDISVELRVEEHIAAINALLNLFAMQTGFSSGTFTFDGQSMKTATEVVSEQSKTFKSKQSHEIIIEAGLIELIESILAIAELYELHTSTEDHDISIAFDDSIAEDADAEADRQIKLVSAELQSKKRAIKKIFGVTDDEAMKIVAEIKEERLESSPDLDELEKEGAMFGNRE